MTVRLLLLALALGESFDLKAFHDVVIGHGSLPLSLLEREVERHIDETRTSTNPDAIAIR